MRKLFLIILITFAVSLIMGCNDDNASADLQWDNQQPTSVNDIIWVDQDGDEHKRWSGDYDQNIKTDFKEVTLMNGHGECSAGGSAYQIEYFDGSYQTNISLSDGESRSVTINYITEITK